jgi:hypothetical protein
MRAVLQELRLIAPILFVAGFLTRSALKRITAAAPNDNDVPWLLSALMAGILAAGQSIALTAGAECSNWFLRSYLGFQIPRILAGSVGAGFGSAAGESFLGFLRISAENNLIIKPSKINFFLEFRSLCEEVPGAFLGGGVIWYLLDSLEEEKIEFVLQEMLSLVMTPPFKETFARLLSYVIKSMGISLLTVGSAFIINKLTHFSYERVVSKCFPEAVTTNNVSANNEKRGYSIWNCFPGSFFASKKLTKYREIEDSLNPEIEVQEEINIEDSLNLEIEEKKSPIRWCLIQ